MPAYLTDFGLARPASTASKYTRSGQALGTPVYMAPEIARGEDGAYAAAADVWGLGCVLYELLAGRPAFEGDTVAAVIACVQRETPPRVGLVRPGLPPGPEAVVHHALAKRVQDRYGSARELADDCRRVLAGMPVAAPAVRRGWLLALGAGSVVVAAAAGLAFHAAYRRQAPAPASAPPPPSPADALAARADGLASTDPRGAAALLRQTLALEPNRQDRRVRLGLLCWAAGERASALAAWEAVPAGHPAAPEARLYAVLLAYFDLRVADALTGLAPLRDAPGRTGRLARALDALIREDWLVARAALAGEEGFEPALLRASLEMFDPAGDRAVGLRAFSEALDSGIPFAWAHANRATARHEFGDEAGALADLERALALDPKLAVAYLNRAMFHQTHGDLDAAAGDFDAAVEAQPEMAKVWLARASFRRQREDLAGTLADLTRATELDPGLVDAHAGRGATLFNLGDPEGALAAFARVIALAPGHSDAWQSRGTILAALGRHTEALEALDGAIARGAENADAYTNRGNSRANLGDLPGALADFERAVALDPTVPEGWLGRALVRSELQSPAAGAEDLAHALAIAPPDWPRRAEYEALLARFRAGTGAGG